MALRTRTGLSALMVALCQTGSLQAFAETHAVVFVLHASTDLSMTYNAAYSSDTAPYLPWTSIVNATIETQTDPAFGPVVTSISIESGSTDSTTGPFYVTDETGLGPIDLLIRFQSPFASLSSPQVMPAVPTSASASSFDVSSIDYVIYEGQLISYLPGPPEVLLGHMELSDANMVLPTSGSGTIRLVENHVTKTVDVFLTLPLNGTARSPYPYIDIAGNLELSGTFPLTNQALPLPPLVGWISLALLGYTGWRCLLRVPAKRVDNAFDR